MKKLFFSLIIVVISGLFMTFYVANVAEREIKLALSESSQTGFTVALKHYQRNFFTATAITSAQIEIDTDTTLSVSIKSTIYHYPYQAVINNVIEIDDEVTAKRAQNYFSSKQWVTSTEKINLFSQLSGQLRIASGKYESESESFVSEPVLIDYQVDLKNKSGHANLNWAGVKGATYGADINLQSLHLAYHFGTLLTMQDYEYQLTIAEIALSEEGGQFLLTGIDLTGSSKIGQDKQTVDTNNALLIEKYQVAQETFTDNRLTLALSGLSHPAFERLKHGADKIQEIEGALSELVSHGATLNLSQISSNTPWGEVDGIVDLTLAEGASLTDIRVNPYTLFDYVEGNANLLLPTRLLKEPDFSEILQLGLVTGFLEQKGETLNLKSSFHQGELIVNDKVIPL